MLTFCRLAAVVCALFCTVTAAAQENNRAEQQAQFHFGIARTLEKITIDGALDEGVWQKAEVATNFHMKWPRDGGPAPQRTEARCTYDDNFLYIGITAIDSTPNHVVFSLKRDVGYWDSDAVAVVLDPMNVTNNGYFFGVSSAGVQTEALLSGGGDGNMDENWDNTWYVETKLYPDRWTAEYAIPLRILRYNEGQTTWGINFIRNDLGKNIYSVWARIPFQFDGVDLGWTGALNWDAAPGRAKGNYNISPFVTGALTRDYEANGAWTAKPNAGLDAKIGIGSSLNLDVTVNPDFSQIEIDEQVINLTRFNVMLPEKRTFFLENADLFGNFGIPPVRPFFSRRIGLNNDGTPVPIIGGLRLTGNVGENTRIGLMNMQTRAKGETPARNYTAAVVNRRLYGRSTVSGYFLNREDFQQNERQKDAFSRNAGMEFSHISTDGKWQAWTTHHRTFKTGISNQNWWGNAGVGYTGRNLSVLVDFTHAGDNYFADMGFERRLENYDVVRDTVLRIGFNFIFMPVTYRIFPKKKASKINFIEISGEFFNVINPNGTLNESSNQLSATINFKNTSEISFSSTPTWANVPVAFKFDNEEDLIRCPPLLPGIYRFTSSELSWTSDYRKPFIVSFSAGGGQFYNGHQLSFSSEITWRFQPILNLTLTGSYNHLYFPAPQCDVQLLNITPRVEVFFGRNLWWTTFIQYNDQANNFNINSRLQWRYRPMSDFFLVYTDNYTATTGNVKNRALVLKANYWL
jgi:Domain of unknown function (DUF5916)/Carbohydrate family 9 binding domain-like